MSRDELEYLCAMSDLDETGAVGFERAPPLSGIIIVRWEGNVRAYLNKCPHIGTPLEMFPNHFLNELRTELVCTTHGARFAVSDGACLEGPCLGEALRRVPIQVQGEDIYLERSLLKE